MRTFHHASQMKQSLPNEYLKDAKALEGVRTTPPRIAEFIPPQRRHVQEHRKNSNTFATITLKRHECRAPFAGYRGSILLLMSVVFWCCTGAVSLQSQETGKPTSKAKKYPTEVPFNKDAEPLRIAFVSYANPQQVVKDAQAVADYLRPYVGVPIQSSVTLDYGSSIESMRGDNTDLAFVDPLAFMMAHEQIGAEPLLLEIYHYGKPTYHSNIWVRKDSGIERLEDLKGQTIAFADQVDMSGHLLPRDIFVEKGLVTARRLQGEFFKQVYFAGGDEQAIRSVLNRFVTAAGVSEYASLLLRPEERDSVKVIASSIESPSHLVMARKGVTSAIKERVKNALLALDASRPADKVVLDKLYGVQGFSKASLADFEEVAKVAARYGFVKNAELFTAENDN